MRKMADPFRRDDLPAEISDINVVPLADVSLVLLILLLVLSPMMAQSMLHVKTAAQAQEALPERFKQTYALPSSRDLVLVVDLGPKGIAVGANFFVSHGEFVAFMTGELSRRSDRKVFLAPHPDVTHGTVVHMLDTLKTCGAASLALVQSSEE